MDNLYILNHCIHKAVQRNKGRLFAFFIDYKAAFDTVDRRILIEQLQKMWSAR